MSIHVALHHQTHYRYDRMVALAPHLVRLRPAPHSRTTIRSYSLRIEPAGHFINWQQDPHGNYLARLVFPEKTRELRVEVDLVAEMAVQNPFDFFLEPGAEDYPLTYEAGLRKQLAGFLEASPLGRRGGELGARLLRERGRTVDVLVALNRQLQQQTRYVIRLEPGVQSPEETLQRGQGSCRDSAWLLVQLLRHAGLAARFVSGYLVQLTPDVKALDGPSGATHDFTDLHAWAEVYLPGAGWIGLDPTSGLLAGEGHIPLACTPDPIDAAPIAGGVDPCESSMEHAMRVTRIQESPRVTKPYTEAQWEAIEALGRQVDAALQAGDVRLTMGGEPTFVSIDDMDGEEWTTAALGPVKRARGGDLIKRLRRRFAPGGLLFYGQGKWYPGESLPRWALSCYWRKDGQPIWNDESLIADESRDSAHGAAEAQQFIETLAQFLGVGGEHVMPAYEDAWYYLWRERRLPVNVDPLRADLKDSEERTRLARLLERGLGAVVGYALPLARGAGPQPGWQSGPWFFRPETLFLTPGDSPMGYRLPMDSLPWVAAGDALSVHPPDPTCAQPPLPGADVLRRQAFVRPEPVQAARRSEPPGARPGVGGELAKSNQRAPQRGVSAAGLTRTALCVEPRHGRLHVFYPPLATTEDFLDLTAAIEATAAQLQLQVILEGEPPPFDPRLDLIRVTPDPGVIEVNLHPSANWTELVERTTILYDEARLARLGTEKFLLDGRHTGTGGGNHILLGGATPADSPLLRRPDLLRSLLAYWHNHPALSYLFSGLFLGPTSQHPRVDEARNDTIYEMELAFRQVPPHGACPPWLVDRVFRHLLTDVTGNTHRAEFCIDKLYAPEAAAGRIGLVELRSLEMPPHARMSLAQHLLLRGLVARFWQAPYAASLARWGTELHDRFMLPHFVWQDFHDVIDDLRAAGFPLELEWFAPHFEFRFPVLGAIVQRGVELELRTALEPWHVLGEEPGAGGAVRYVDASVERIEAKVRGWVPNRYQLTCNGRALPLRPTGTVGEFVAGVRYRAWQPPNCLHPTIPVHAPLVFDLVDRWNGRALGGCTYHVMHPGGRAYTTFPVNAYEAESRRRARFFPGGHSPGPLAAPDAVPSREFPLTLDLRDD